MRKRRSLKQQWISSLSTFFDIQSSKAKQYGFCMDLGKGKKLTCCGDEPYNACEEKYARDSEWLLLYHTEDRNLDQRKSRYIEEGSRYYHGNLFSPDDLESVEL